MLEPAPVTAKDEVDVRVNVGVADPGEEVGTSAPQPLGPALLTWFTVPGSSTGPWTGGEVAAAPSRVRVAEPAPAAGTVSLRMGNSVRHPGAGRRIALGAPSIGDRPAR